MKKTFRHLLFLLPMIVSYTIFLILFFGGSVPIISGIALSPLLILIAVLIIFLFFLNLSIPDMKKLGIMKWQIFFLLSFFGGVILIRGIQILLDYSGFFQSNGFQFLGGTFLIAGIMFLLSTKEASLNNRVSLNFLIMHYSGVFMFSLFVSLFISLFSFGSFKSVPLSCNDIQSTQDELIGLLFSPVRKSTDAFTTVKESVSTFLKKDAGETLQGFAEYTIKSASNTPGLLEEVKNTIVLDVLVSKKYVDESVCDFLMQSIVEKRNSPGLQYTVVFLFFLLLYPVLSIVFLVISLLSYVIFFVCKKVGLRDIVQSMMLVEDID